MKAKIVLFLLLMLTIVVPVNAQRMTFGSGSTSITSPIATNPLVFSGATTFSNNATSFGDATGPVVLTFLVTGADPTLTVSLGSLLFPASTYLQFGATVGTLGYGIFDEAGTMKFKNSGGAWSPFASEATAILNSIIVAEGDLVLGSGAGAATVFTKCSANEIFYVNGAGAWDCMGSIALAGTTGANYNFYDPTDPTKIGQVYMDGMTTGKYFKLLFNNAADAVYTFPPATATLMAQSNEKLASFAWDGGASAVTTGATTKRCTIFPGAATIVGAYAMADASTTTHFHVYQDAFAAGARSTTVTGAVDIGATLGSVDTTLAGWDKSITAADEICISVEANNNAKWLNVIVYGIR